MSDQANWKGPFTVFVLLISAFLGSIFILFPFFLLIILAPKLWRASCDRMVGFWLSFPVVLLEFLFGCRVEVEGEEICRDQTSLLIMNHRTRLDWLFFWTALFKMDPWLLTSEKIALKRTLKKIPGAGWAMQCMNFIFLSRRWDKDQEILSKTLNYFAGVNRQYQILLYPEGTDMCNNARGRSRKYAEEKGLPDYNNVLHPRVTGLIFLIQQMRSKNYLEFVYDVNVAYGDYIIQHELDFVAGRCPHDIKFHVRKYRISEIPFTDEGIARWCKAIWKRKEEILGLFYAGKPVRGSLGRAVREIEGRIDFTSINFDDPSEEAVTGAVEKVFEDYRRSIANREHPIKNQEECNGNIEGLNGNYVGTPPSTAKHTAGRDFIWPMEFDGYRKVAICLSSFFWLSTVWVWIYFFFMVTAMRVCFFAAIVSFLFIHNFRGGMDNWVIENWRRQYGEKEEVGDKKSE